MLIAPNLDDVDLGDTLSLEGVERTKVIHPVHLSIPDPGDECSNGCPLLNKQNQTRVQYRRRC